MRVIFPRDLLTSVSPASESAAFVDLAKTLAYAPENIWSKHVFLLHDRGSEIPLQVSTDWKQNKSDVTSFEATAGMSEAEQRSRVAERAWDGAEEETGPGRGTTVQD